MLNDGFVTFLSFVALMLVFAVVYICIKSDKKKTGSFKTRVVKGEQTNELDKTKKTSSTRRSKEPQDKLTDEAPIKLSGANSTITESSITNNTIIPEWKVQILDVKPNGAFRPIEKNGTTWYLSLANIIDENEPRSKHYYIELGKHTADGNSYYNDNVHHISFPETDFDKTFEEKHLIVFKRDNKVIAKDISHKGNTRVYDSNSGLQILTEEFEIKHGTIARIGNLWIRFLSENSVDINPVPKIDTGTKAFSPDDKSNIRSLASNKSREFDYNEIISID